MANTYTQIHIQFVFAVKYRRAQITAAVKDELYKYISGIIRNYNHKLLAINGMSDHIHIFIGMRPTQSVSDLMKEVKGCSSLWINNRQLYNERFEWQEGYGAFSYSRSQVQYVIDYVNNQQVHHRRKSFREEYVDFLKKFEIDYDERYIFKELL